MDNHGRITAHPVRRRDLRPPYHTVSCLPRVSSGVFSAEHWSQEQHHSRTEQQTLSGSGTTQQTHYYDGQSATAQFACEAAAVAGHYYEAGSAVMALCAGMRFRLNDHPAAEYNGEYYISEITHTIDCSESSGSPVYSNTFRCHQSRTPFRLPPVSAPRYDGIQAATVVAREETKPVMTHRGG